MTDIARMRFQSAKNPDETGTLALAADGTVRIEPSEAMLEKIAALEQTAVETSTRNSAVAAAVLIGLGLAVAAVGWMAARIGGRLRDRLTEPRPVKSTEITFEPLDGLHVSFNEGMLRSAKIGWAPGEYNADEAEQFYEAYRRLRQLSVQGHD